MKSIIPFFLAIFLICAQNPAPAPDTVIRINVNLVQVDAVVADSKDKPVTDLRKEDFEILQDGKPQAITNFAFINATPGGASSTIPAPRPVPPARGTVPPPPPSFSRTNHPLNTRRTIALVVDDLGLSFESIARLRSSLK